MAGITSADTPPVDTEQAICDAGFEITGIRRFRFAPDPLSAAAAPKILGLATAPTAPDSGVRRT